ncbi:DnaJ family domain-containing protein [Jatrophihabitans sp. YIM 134969]
MTRRKPPGLSYRSWVDQQVREAEARGSFDNLPGKGKPLPNIDRPQNELEWIAGMLKRENVDASILLPPSLRLRKEVQDLRSTLAAEPSEPKVRAHVEDLNQRIREAHRRPQEGPPLTVMSQDVESTVARWREDRAELRAAYEADRARRRAETPAPQPRRHHRFFRVGRA